MIIQRNVRAWLRWRHGLPRFKKAVIALQSRYRTWRPKRYVQGLREQAGLEIRRLPSKPVILLHDQNGNPSKYRAFKTKTSFFNFVKPKPEKADSSQADDALKSSVSQIQAFWRYKRLLRVVLKLQAMVRGRIARKKVKNRLNRLKLIQAACGLRCAHLRFRVFKQRIIKIQAAVRGMLVRRRLARELEATRQEEDAEKDELGNFVMDAVLF